MYLAFDIGIANLAYCIIDSDGKIKKWRVIDLCDKKEPPTCCGKTKKGDLCGKKAKYVTENVKDCYCLTHSKKLEEKQLYDIIVQPICQHEKCKAKIRWMRKDNCYRGWCGTHFKRAAIQKDKDSYTEYCKPLTPAQLAKDIDLLTNLLFAKLDTIPELLEVNHVGLENQPCLKQPLMKTVQIALYSYLKIRGSVDKEKNGISSFKMINAGMKCKNKAKSYAQRKKDSINECKEELKTNQQEWLSFFNNHKKKDDLADAYNLALTMI